MNRRDQRTLDEELERHQRRIERLANLRLRRLRRWFQQTFPRHSLQITFGNGTEMIEVDGRPVWLEDETPYFGERRSLANVRAVPCLQLLAEAIRDVDEITDGYHRGCPDDIQVKARARGRLPGATGAISAK